MQKLISSSDAELIAREALAGLENEWYELFEWRESIEKAIVVMIVGESLVDSDEARSMLARELRHSIRDNLSIRGNNVGGRAANALGGIWMQGSLSSIHRNVAARSEFTFDLVSDIITGAKSSDKIITIIGVDREFDTLETIWDKFISEIPEVTLPDILIESPPRIDDAHELYDGNLPYDYDLFSAMFHTSDMQNAHLELKDAIKTRNIPVMILMVDYYALHKYKIDPQFDIAHQIKLVFGDMIGVYYIRPRKKKVDDSGYFLQIDVYAKSALSVQFVLKMAAAKEEESIKSLASQMDIVSNKSERAAKRLGRRMEIKKAIKEEIDSVSTNISTEKVQHIILSTIASRSLAEIEVSGISGIHGFFPERNVYSKGMLKTTYEADLNQYMIYVDAPYLQISGIKSDDFVQSLEGEAVDNQHGLLRSLRARPKIVSNVTARHLLSLDEVTVVDPSQLLEGEINKYVSYKTTAANLNGIDHWIRTLGLPIMTRGLEIVSALPINLSELFDANHTDFVQIVEQLYVVFVDLFAITVTETVNSLSPEDLAYYHIHNSINMCDFTLSVSGEMKSLSDAERLVEKIKAGVDRIVDTRLGGRFKESARLVANEIVAQNVRPEVVGFSAQFPSWYARLERILRQLLGEAESMPDNIVSLVANVELYKDLKKRFVEEVGRQYDEFLITRYGKFAAVIVSDRFAYPSFLDKVVTTIRIEANELINIFREDEIFEGDVLMRPTDVPEFREKNETRIVVSGNNLPRLALVDGVDTRKTFITNIYEAYDHYGIDGLFTMIASSVKHITDSVGSRINSHHIHVMASYMTAIGIPRKIDYDNSPMSIADPAHAFLGKDIGKQLPNAMKEVSISADVGLAPLLVGGIGRFGTKWLTEEEQRLLDNLIEQGIGVQSMKYNPMTGTFPEEGVITTTYTMEGSGRSAIETNEELLQDIWNEMGGDDFYDDFYDV